MEWKQTVERRANGVLAPSSDTRFDKLPARAMLAVARTLAQGMKYEKNVPDNWRLVPAAEHLDHALRHLFLEATGDRSEEHVAHVAARILMWAELRLLGGAS